MASFYMTVFNPFAKLAAFLDADTFFDRFEYDRCMLKTKRQMELSARQQTPKVWADVCFTHCIFTKLFDMDQRTVEWLREEAESFYKKIGHYRALLLCDLANGEWTGELTFEKFSPPAVESPLIKFADVETLFLLEPKIKHLARAGQISDDLYFYLM